MNNRLKDANWQPGENGTAPTWERAIVAILLDLRDEMKRLNALLHCHNMVAIPEILRGIKRNTTKPRKKAKAKR